MDFDKNLESEIKNIDFRWKDNLHAVCEDCRKRENTLKDTTGNYMQQQAKI
jgi:hypothetical protein